MMNNWNNNPPPVGFYKDDATTAAVAVPRTGSESSYNIDSDESSNCSSSSSSSIEHSRKKNNVVVSNRSRFGRVGDHRMHRAVAAKLDNPKLSLFEALEIGGFNEYYSTGDGGYNLEQQRDSNMITLKQRKNQLSRRLRNIRNANKKNGKTKAVQRMKTKVAKIAQNIGIENETLPPKPPVTSEYYPKLYRIDQECVENCRRGDIRMYRAVHAILAYPDEISLFDALKFGGFEYDDDDPFAVDYEMITLQQRINNLKKRLRLAKKWIEMEEQEAIAIPKEEEERIKAKAVEMEQEARARTEEERRAKVIKELERISKFKAKFKAEFEAARAKIRAEQQEIQEPVPEESVPEEPVPEEERIAKVRAEFEAARARIRAEDKEEPLWDHSVLVNAAAVTATTPAVPGTVAGGYSNNDMGYKEKEPNEERARTEEDTIVRARTGREGGGGEEEPVLDYSVLIHAAAAPVAQNTVAGAGAATHVVRDTIDGDYSNSNNKDYNGYDNNGYENDPRMYRAYLARMNNPNLSLFDALVKFGGYQYLDDGNPIAFDSDMVPLGQRKLALLCITRAAAGIRAGVAGVGAEQEEEQVEQQQQQQQYELISDESDNNYNDNNERTITRKRSFLRHFSSKKSRRKKDSSTKKSSSIEYDDDDNNDDYDNDDDNDDEMIEFLKIYLAQQSLRNRDREMKEIEYRKQYARDEDNNMKLLFSIIATIINTYTGQNLIDIPTLTSIMDDESDTDSDNNDSDDDLDDDCSVSL